jgi:hypothetical protein
VGPTEDAARLGSPPETLIPRFPGWIVVGESMTLLAAARLHRPEARVLISLPETVDPGLRQLAASLAARDPALTLLAPRD